eukprot:6296617-Pyramimonas_sp.AAC.1
MGCARVARFQGNNRRTRRYGPGLRRTWGREQRAGQGRAAGRTVSAAAAEGRWQRTTTIVTGG